MKTKKTLSAILLATILLSLEPPLRVTASTLGISQPTICVRLPTQPKTKCRKRIIASEQAPQAWADKIDFLWKELEKYFSIIREVESKYPNYIPITESRYFEAQSKSGKILRDLKVIAKKFPNYFKPDYLLKFAGD